MLDRLPRTLSISICVWSELPARAIIHSLTVCVTERERDRVGGWEMRGRWEMEEGWLDMNGRREGQAGGGGVLGFAGDS